MRPWFAWVLSAALPTSAFALGDLVSFERLHSECVAAGGVSFGPQGRWADCRPDKVRWFSTLGHEDFYQAQYCLSDGSAGCAQRALLLFVNRAYTPVAKMLLARIDAGDTEYADPQVLQTAGGSVLILETRRAGAPAARHYYLWSMDAWQPIDTAAWQRELSRRLPAGWSVKAAAVPDFETMRAQVPVTRKDGRAAGERFADVELALVNARLTVRKVALF